MVWPYSFLRLFIYRVNELRRLLIASSYMLYTYPMVKVTPHPSKSKRGILELLNVLHILALISCGNLIFWRVKLKSLYEFKSIIIITSFKISQLQSQNRQKGSLIKYALSLNRFLTFLIPRFFVLNLLSKGRVYAFPNSISQFGRFESKILEFDFFGFGGRILRRVEYL